MVQNLGICTTHMGGADEAPGSWLQHDSALAIEANQWSEPVEGRFLSFSLFKTLPLKENESFNSN